ncbi:MAG: hypothetical protein IPG46_16850 [Actinobacteria bacterium]|nr:hypothetical protein [Actinomycetota bacterium]
MEDLEPTVEVVRPEGCVLVEPAVLFDHVDLVVRCVQQHMTPEIGDRADVRLPVDVARTEIEIRSEELVLHDVGVLARDHLEDLGA